MFLSTDARELFVDWEDQARTVVENLRLDVGNAPHDPMATALVDELSMTSFEFRAWWSEHRVYQRTYDVKRLHYPVVGDLTLDYETLAMPGDSDQALFVFTAATGPLTRAALNLLLSWSLNSQNTIQPRNVSDGDSP